MFKAIVRTFDAFTGFNDLISNTVAQRTETDKHQGLVVDALCELGTSIC